MSDTSTNKVYGAAPNELPLVELEKRWEIDPTHRYRDGIDETMRIDQSDHSLYGVSKLSADLMVQEYGRHFEMQTAVFRGGCLTGPNHSGAKLHGFLAYLLKCVATGRHYTIFGYKGKQVRDNIHSFDFVCAIDEVFRAPRCGEVDNVGGTRFSACGTRSDRTSERITGRRLDWTYAEGSRYGDHKWYVTDMTKFKSHYPNWQQRFDLNALLADMYEKNTERWGMHAERSLAKRVDGAHYGEAGFPPGVGRGGLDVVTGRRTRIPGNEAALFIAAVRAGGQEYRGAR